MVKRDDVVDIIPAIELIECKKQPKLMKEYLQKLKSMEHNQAKKDSLENLKKSKIIGENGEFTELYECCDEQAYKKFYIIMSHYYSVSNIKKSYIKNLR